MTRIARTGLVLLAYTLLGLILTWPVIGHLTTRVAGEGGDPWQSLWRLHETAISATTAWQHELLGQGEGRLVNLSAWPWLWLQLAVGEIATYNIIWLLSYILAGFGMYALVRYVLKQWSANPERPQELPSFLAGLLYMLVPYHVAQSLGHFGALQIEWIPLALLAWLTWLRHPTWWRTMALALVMIMQAWTEHHYALWLLVTFVWIAYWMWSTETVTVTKKYVSPALFLFLLLLVGVVVPYLPTIRLARVADSTLSLGEDQVTRFSADMLAPIIPPATHTIWGRMFKPLYESGLTGNVAEATQYLGIIPLLLVIFFYTSIPTKQRKLWAGLAMIFLVLSFGPRLHILGWVTPIPLPYALLQHLPVFSSVRTVARAGVIVAASFAVLFGWVLHTQVTRKQIYVLLGVVIVVEFLSVPFPTQSARLNSVYEWVQQLPGSTVIEVPAATNYVVASQALYAETMTGKTTLGNIALERAQTADELDYVQSLPGIRQFLYVRTTDIRQDRREFFGQDVVEALPDVLRWMKVSAIVLDTDSLSILQLKSLQQLADSLHVPVRQLDDVIAYDTSNLPTTSDGVFLRRGAGWTGVGFDKDTGHTLAQIEHQTAVGVINVSNTVKPVTLSFMIKQPEQAKLSVTVGDMAVASTVKDQLFTTTVAVPPGEQTVTFTNQGTEPLVIQDPQLIVNH